MICKATPRRRSRPFLLTGGLVLVLAAVTLLAGCQLVPPEWRWTASATSREIVPQLQGVTVEEAIASLEELGFRATVQLPGPADACTACTGAYLDELVESTDPLAGAALDEGAEVQVIPAKVVSIDGWLETTHITALKNERPDECFECHEPDECADCHLLEAQESDSQGE
jgi:hypothetical protein